MSENETLDHTKTTPNTAADREVQNERPRREQRSRRPTDREKRRPRRGRRRKEDYFHVNNTIPDYKDTQTLRRFLTDRAKIRPRRQTGLTSKHQRMLSRQIKRARHLALLPFTGEHTRR